MNFNCKYHEWLTEYTFDNCKLNRKEYGEFLTNYIKGEHDGFVLNLNGAWGTGKTEFLRRLYSHLINEGNPTVYIDAWESDFSEIPLSVVASELIKQLSMINDNIGSDLDKLTGFLGKALKGVIIAGAGLATKHLVDDSAAGREVAKTFFETSPKDFLTSIKKDHEEQVEAIKSIRKELGLLAEVLKQTHGKELPVIVLIDELDRCRPNYAIEMLEVIKHFFATKNFVFVVATDTTQLQESIKSVYGSNFDSNTYLKRFFNREARLAEPDLEHYLKLQEVDLTPYSEKVVLYPNLTNNMENNIRQYIIWVAKAYELSLRDVDQTIDKLKACLRGALYAEHSSNKVQVINIFSLLLGIVEFDLKNTSFDERKNDKPCIDGGLYKHNISLDSHSENVFSELYELNMYNSVKHSIEFQDGWGDNQKGLVYGTHIKAKGKDYDHYKGIIKKVANEIDCSFFNFNQQKDEVKIWLWPDYQKVIKLAGNLD